MHSFWQQIDADLDRIETEQPNTYAGVAEILKTQTDPDTSDAPAFFAGSGGDRSLQESLDVAGWRIAWAEADYHYVARHPGTGETLTYCEGDVYPGIADWIPQE